jgi:hypothetical protein
MRPVATARTSLMARSMRNATALCSNGLIGELYLSKSNVMAAGRSLQLGQHVRACPPWLLQALVATLTHDERLKDGQEVYLQFALLYTTTDGHRRIR